VTEIWSLDYSLGKGVLNYLKTIYLRFWKVVVVAVNHSYVKQLR